MAYFDLTGYNGLATTEFIIDASAIDAGVLDDHATTTGSGVVHKQSNLTTPGGQVTLSTGEDGSAAVGFPVRFVSSLGSLRAVVLEVFGLECSTSRGQTDLKLYRGDSLGAGLRWDDSGAVIEAATSSGQTLAATAKDGNFNNVASTDAGIFCDVSEPRANPVLGHFGAAKVSTPPEADLRGLWQGRLSVAGAEASISFRQLRLTLMWGIPGDITRKVY